MIFCAKLLVLLFCFQAIAHYEQAADYYKGEESNRYSICAETNTHMNGAGTFSGLINVNGTSLCSYFDNILIVCESIC